MARYIDADKMIDDYCTTFPYDLAYCDDGDLKEWLDAQPTANVAPRAEVAREIIFDLACKLHTMLPHKIHPIPIDGKIECNTYELGQEHIIFNTLKYLGELEKKYTEEQK